MCVCVCVCVCVCIYLHYYTIVGRVLRHNIFRH